MCANYCNKDTLLQWKYPANHCTEELENKDIPVALTWILYSTGDKTRRRSPLVDGGGVMSRGTLFSSVGFRLRVAFFLAALPPLRPALAGIP